MKQKAFEKMVHDDAQRWLAAEMAYGEGAGTRRKLLNAELQAKFDDALYYDAFHRAYEALDQNKFALAAVKERKALDRAAKAGQNLRAIKSGNYQNLSTGIFLIAGAAYVAHKTGYDQVIITQAKLKYAQLKVKYQERKRSHLSVVNG